MDDGDYLASPAGPPPATLFGSPMPTSPPAGFGAFGGVPAYASPAPTVAPTPGSATGATFAVGGFTSPSLAHHPQQQQAAAGDYEDDFEGEAAAAPAPAPHHYQQPRVQVTLEAPSTSTEQPGVTRTVASRPSSRPASRPASSHGGSGGSSGSSGSAVLAAPAPGGARAPAAADLYSDDFDSGGGGGGGDGGGASAAASPPSIKAALAQAVQARFHSPKHHASPIAVLDAQRAGAPEPPTPRGAPPASAPAPSPARAREARELVDSSVANLVDSRVRERVREAAAAQAARLEAAVAEKSAELREHYAALLAAKDKAQRAVEKRLRAAAAESEALRQRLSGESIAGRVTALEAST